MLSYNIFYFIFLIQILFISWYIPKKLCLRMQTVREKYPPEDYPKLYTKSLEGYKKTQNIFELMNRILLTIGFAIFSAIFMWDYLTDGELSQMIPWAYFMLQMIPLMWLEFSEIKYFQAMRASNKDTTKVAMIEARRLFDFISPKLLILALVMMSLAFILVLINYGFNSKSFLNIIIILGTNLFFAAVIYWSIYGKKLDPHQTTKDRLQQIKVAVKSPVYISIGVSIFLSVQMLLKIYELKYLQPSVMSIYCQLIVWASMMTRLKELKLKNIDFSVYKK